uniref:Uncharacterized protein n=1 Tax=Arundo donax TaxID=35708 RepID=A0A0A9AE35_ARUDO
MSIYTARYCKWLQQTP